MKQQQKKEDSKDMKPYKIKETKPVSRCDEAQQQTFLQIVRPRAEKAAKPIQTAHLQQSKFIDRDVRSQQLCGRLLHQQQQTNTDL